MDFYEEASLVMVPSGYKDQKVYSSVPDDGSADLTFSRASTATRVNSDGYIEKAKVNLLTYSNDTSNPAWTRVGAAPTSGQSGYDGSSDAWLLSATGAGAHYALQNKADTGVFTFSVYAKQGTSKGIRISINGGGDHWANFNLDLGTQVGTAPSVVDTEITSVGGGWYRISVTANKTGSGWGVVYVLDNSFNPSFTAAGETIYIQDAQLNYGLVAQDYIETTTASVTEGIAIDVPRLTYDPANPTCPSLLLEGSRTNLVTQSEYIGGLNVTGGMAMTANYATSPEGVQNAYLMARATSGNFNYDISATSGQEYVLSVFAKAGTSSIINITTTDTAFPTATVQFDLNDQSTSVTLGTFVDSDIEDYGNGWYRCWAVQNATATGNGEVRTNTEDNVNILVWGVSCEAGSYPTSYIPTYGSSATRTADACSKTGISSLIGQTEGTIFVEIQKENLSANSRAIAIGDGTSSNRAIIFSSSTNKVRFYFRDSASFYMDYTYSGVDLVGNMKLALAYKSNDLVAYVDGVQVATATTAVIPAMSNVYIGTSEIGASNQELEGGVKQALVFKTRLSNAELVTLTTP